MGITDKKYQNIDNYLIKNLSDARYRHSVSTGKTAEKLCRKFGLDHEKGFFTGLIHDIAREYDNDEIIKICAEKGEDVSEYELENPVLLHGKAGAALLREKFNINDNEILDAVRVHTTGDSGMGSIAKVLFVADYIEPCRTHITDDFLKSLENSCLDKMVEKVLKSILEYIESKGKNPAGSSIELLKELEL